MSAAMAQGVRATHPVPPELGDLVRALAGTFGRAQKRLAMRQEQLLSTLRADGNLAKLYVKLPDGKTVALSPLDLCTPARGYLQDMVVDLRCVVEEIRSQGSRRLGLRILTVPQQSPDTVPLRLWFAEDNPIKVELRVAGEVVRAMSLHDAELPSQEACARSQQASVLLLDEADADWAEKYAVPLHANTIDEESEPVFIEAMPELAMSAHAVQRGTQTFVEHQTDSRPPQSEAIPAQVATAKPQRSRKVLLAAIVSVVMIVICAVLLRFKYGPQRGRSHRKVESAQEPSKVTPQRIFVPAGQTDDVEPPPAGVILPAVSAKAAVSTALRVRFYATAKDGVKTISCNGKAVPLTASGASRRLEARVVLQPGESCTATGEGKDRHYSYREFLSESVSATGERSRHVRFRKK